MLRKVLFAVTIGILLLTPALGCARTSYEAQQLNGDTSTTKGALELAGGKLKYVITILSRIDTTKVITVADSQEFDKGIYDYASSMKAACDLALKDARDAAESRGEKGNVASLAAFEDVAKKHEGMVKNLADKAKAVDAQVRTGTIRPDKPLVIKMNSSEVKDFYDYLAPEGRKVMEQLYPTIFKPPTAEKGTSPRPEVALSRESELSAGESGISSAPVLAAGCVAVCQASAWTGCLSCIIGAGEAAKKAYDAFKRNYNACKGWWKNACKTSYLLLFISALG
ncbi:MAG: hypothetical protein FJZ93_08760 [Chloroflexi bacterium]|nr:hypothetical protein [Chloroflexota bacterium]